MGVIREYKVRISRFIIRPHGIKRICFVFGDKEERGLIAREGQYITYEILDGSLYFYCVKDKMAKKDVDEASVYYAKRCIKYNFTAHQANFNKQEELEELTPYLGEYHDAYSFTSTVCPPFLRPLFKIDLKDRHPYNEIHKASSTHEVPEVRRSKPEDVQKIEDKAKEITDIMASKELVEDDVISSLLDLIGEQQEACGKEILKHEVEIAKLKERYDRLKRTYEYLRGGK